MASRNSAIVSKFVKRSLSASTQPEQVKKPLKHFTEIPGLNVKDVLVGMFKADLRKGLENTAALWVDTIQDFLCKYVGQETTYRISLNNVLGH